MSFEEYTESEIREMGQKEFRKKFPSGWMELARFETLALLIDVFIEESPDKAFTPEELDDLSGSNKKSIKKRIDSLVELGVVDEITKEGKKAYCINAKSPITKDLFRLDSTVEMVKNGELPRELSDNDLYLSDDMDGNTFESTIGGSNFRVDPDDAVFAD